MFMDVYLYVHVSVCLCVHMCVCTCTCVYSVVKVVYERWLSSPDMGSSIKTGSGGVIAGNNFEILYYNQLIIAHIFEAINAH